jgi:hypothetical protein
MEMLTNKDMQEFIVNAIKKDLAYIANIELVVEQDSLPKVTLTLFLDKKVLSGK